jgi:quercetin dioxygenase-like cupin family protein
VAHEEWLDLAEVYALNALEGDELTQFQAHLSSGCALCKARLTESAETLALLPRSLEWLTPPPELKARVLQQIESERPGYLFVHASQGEWQEFAPGISAKVLNMDAAQGRVTALVRMAPGSRYDNHRHTRTEELFVIEGSCYCGGRLLRAGDYHCAEVGSVHLDTRTDEGSLMLLITSVQNEMLA